MCPNYCRHFCATPLNDVCRNPCTQITSFRCVELICRKFCNKSDAIASTIICLLNNTLPPTETQAIKKKNNDF